MNETTYIGSNGRYGWFICDSTRYNKYLHPDGRWRSSMAMPNGRMGYFGNKEQAEASQPEGQRQIESIWEGI